MNGTKSILLTGAGMLCVFAFAPAAMADGFDGALLGGGAIPGGQVSPGESDTFRARLADFEIGKSTQAPAVAPTVNFSINSDEKNATLSGTFDIGKQNLTVQVQTPFNQGQDYVDIVNLDGLNKASSLSLTYEFKPNTSLLRSLALNGSIGYEQHDFYDPITLAAQSTTKTPWQIGVKAGWLLDPKCATSTGECKFDDAAVKENPNNAKILAGFSFNLSFNYQQAYEDGTDGLTQTKCINSGATCVNGFIGAPSFVQQGLATADFRWIDRGFKLGSATVPIGAQVMVTYDAIQNAEAVQVPIYLATDSSGNLKGGVRYDWTSTTHVSTVGVFVSTGFDIGG
jgi:hypothetical protein